MPKYSNSNYTTISLKYCYEELQKFYPQMTKTEFAVIINATRQNIGQRINRDSKLSKQELSILKEYLEDRGIPTKFLNVAVVNDSIVQIPVRTEVELSCGTGTNANADFVSDTIGLDINFIRNNLNSVQFSFYAIEQVFEKLDGQPTIKDKENAIPMNREHSKIEFKDVNFEYVENVPVLKNINLEINKGETIAFVGNSGGGKTTIVNLLPRFYDIKSGSITVDGTDIRDFTLYSLRQNIAVVFQDNFLFSGTIRENIMLGNSSATEEDLQKAVKMAFLDEFIATLKDGLDTVIGERGVLLSGGQKQRVAIARAFLKDAPIIILDEATSALDNKAEAIVQKAIDNLMQDKTVFVIAHRLSTIQNANKIVVINQGEIVETGTHEELLNIENGAYKTLYEMQFKKQEVSL